MATQTTEIVNRNMAALEQILTDSQDRLASTLPKSIPATQFILVALDLIRGTPSLQGAVGSPEGRLSIVKAVYEASDMGLLLTKHLGHGYLVPYRNREMSERLKREIVEVQFQIGYRGFLELVREADPTVQTVYSRIVWPGEQFQIDEDNHRLSHIPNPKGGEIGIDQQTGETSGYEGAYAKIITTNGHQDFEWMPLHEIEKVRRSSKAIAAGTPWRTWPDQMILKTPMRRLCKRLKLTPAKLAAVVRDEYRDLGVENPPEPHRIQMPQRMPAALPPSPSVPKQAEPKPEEPDYSKAIPPICVICNGKMKFIPAGYSQRTKGDYLAFWVCHNHKDKQHKDAGSTTWNAKEWYEQELARAAIATEGNETAQRDPGEDDDVPF